MTRPAARLAALTQPKQSPYRIRQVVAVNTDNTVDLDWGLDEDLITVTVTVPCESGYPTRTVGDIVRVLIDDNIGWAVVARITTV